MEYHYGIFVSKNVWSAKLYNLNEYITVLACDILTNRLSFFIKILNKGDDFPEEFRDIQFGNPIFFTSEEEKIIDIYRLDILPSFPIFLPNKDILRSYRFVHCYSDQKEYTINDAETDFICSTHKFHLYKKYTDLISHTTTETIESILQEERAIIDSYDINDILNELRVYHNSWRRPTTESCEEYRVSICRNFPFGSKYYDAQFDDYLNKILDIGCRTIEEDEIWLSAEKHIQDIIDSNPINVAKIKQDIKQKYSREDHLNYRLRNRFASVLSIVNLLTLSSAEFININPTIVCKYLPINLGLSSQEDMLNGIKKCNETLFGHDKDVIYSDINSSHIGKDGFII